MEGGQFSGGVNRLTAREIRAALFRSVHGFFLLFGLLFGGVPLVITLVFATIQVRERSLLQSGHPARGAVVEKRISRSDDSTSYRIYYEFRAADGRTYGGDYSASNREYYALEKGDPVDIRYDALDPFRAAVVGHTSFPIWVFGFLSLFIVIGGIFAYLGVRGIRKRLQVYGKGLQTWAKNLGVHEDWSMKVNGRPVKYLAFEFQDMMGAVHQGKSLYLSAEMITKLESMETVPVVYLLERPEEVDLDLDRL